MGRLGTWMSARLSSLGLPLLPLSGWLAPYEASSPLPPLDAAGCAAAPGRRGPAAGPAPPLPPLDSDSDALPSEKEESSSPWRDRPFRFVPPCWPAVQQSLSDGQSRCSWRQHVRHLTALFVKQACFDHQA